MNTRTLIITFVWMIMSNIGICAQEHWDAQERIELNKGVFPKNFSKAIDAIQYDLLGIERGKSHVKVIDNNTLYINLSFSLKNSVQQGDWRIAVKPDFLPSFHWAPHLTPTDRNVIDQHVFRSPALIVADDHQTLILIPDLDIMQKGTPVRWYMDMDASSNTLILGMCNNHVFEHVLFERDQETTYPKGDIEIGFYLMYSDSKEVLRNPFKKPLEFMWSRWGHAAYEKGNPVKENLETYVKHTYNWAFNSWSENVWQQFELDGKKVGAPVFIVNVTQSPNYPGEINEREFRSIWNQAWFSSLRSASGLYRYARRTGNRELLAKANLTKELALSFPQRNGFFYGLIGTEMHEVEIDGKKYNRSKGWNTYYWGNSNRNPYTWNPKESPYHILDMSWTALLMLRWYDELEKDARLLAYAEAAAELEMWSDDIANKTLKALRERAGVKYLAPAKDANFTDFGYTLTPVLQEIRRERRSELALQGFRLDDLMRWKADKLIVGKRGKGAYVGDESILFKSYSPDNQKRIRERLTLDDNKWADPMAGTLPSGYQFHADRDYLLPIPPSELELNKKLKQNPKW